MLKNYFKLAWRSLFRDRQFTFVNLIGLLTGLASAILIYRVRAIKAAIVKPVKSLRTEQIINHA